MDKILTNKGQTLLLTGLLAGMSALIVYTFKHSEGINKEAHARIEMKLDSMMPRQEIEKQMAEIKTTLSEVQSRLQAHEMELIKIKIKVDK